MSTAFHIRKNGENLVCKNQDVPYNGVFLFTNLRDIRKTALIIPPSLPASWISQYGSLTVSQIGKEQPNGGINEVGLVVEQTTLWKTSYPPADRRPSVNELQWIQFLLDTCSTVQEALQAATTIRIDQTTSKLHYLIADRNGDSAIIEFLDGEMFVYKEIESLPILVNSLYEHSGEKENDGETTRFNDDEYEKNSLDRLLKVEKRLKKISNNNDMIEDSFNILSEASRTDTVFSLVYDIDRMEIHASSNQNKEKKVIKVADFHFDNNSPSKAVNLQLLKESNVPNQFVTYNTEFNFRVVNSFFRDPILTSIFQWEVSEEMIQFLAQYPESFQAL